MMHRIPSSLITTALALAASLQQASAYYVPSRILQMDAHNPVGQPTYPFTAENTKKFVDHQFAKYFSDCQAFVDTFVATGDPTDGEIQTSATDLPTAFEYCDGKPECLTTSESLLELCELTVGTKDQIHGNMTIHPGARPRDDFSHIAVTGQQSVCLNIGRDVGFGPLTPLCFEFVITEILHANEDAVHGLQSSLWHGYFNVHHSTCPDLDAPILDCNNRCVVPEGVNPSDANLPSYCLPKIKKNETDAGKQPVDPSSADDGDSNDDSAAPSLLTSARSLSWATARLALLGAGLAAWSAC
mmetsp:Transcript_7833/g.21135  ORF Transcript_7833/g.21135 Transcript_7833/m.21135 type:complete len:300 (-) Transcript_7833:273-1172(-)|eukprot:CAMPEP_0198110430 /NCGR_PEP_ID=MMETSP1442-20131203/2461_1 /TAXON_ID= /ORGANISM="Craspedostauros australis, Strain CCMP3328" /LENGTH=299 /DNA_ID=CAMNT_0043766497 /DNA_START=146 /DNA_END=1045 /DNA_ORIENTATION=+